MCYLKVKSNYVFFFDQQKHKVLHLAKIKNQVVSNQKKKINKFMEKQGLGHSKAIGKMIENLFLFMVYSKSVGSSTSQKKFDESTCKTWWIILKQNYLG